MTSWPATSIVPLRAGPVAGAAENVTVPAPKPGVPPVSVIHDALLFAPHPHPSGACTETLPLPPPGGTDSESGATAYEQPAVCVTVTVWPATTSVPVLVGPADDGIVVVTLNRPAKRNALSIGLRDAVSDALDALAADEAVQVVIVTGAGDTFSAGFDLREFEAAFEDAEVAAAISDRMIDRVIADMRGWLDKGIAFQHVAVNASAAEFRRDNFAERVLEQLRVAEIPTQCFQLEVTETVFLGRGAEYVHRALALLNARGVRIALDDFGTGYASLRHLKQFPVDIIKIDQSFVRDMADDPGDEAIIRAVINLGRSLGIKVVAEGIEYETQARRLLEMDCDFGQGFLFSKAVPAMRVPALVERFRGEPAPAMPGLRLVAGTPR